MIIIPDVHGRDFWKNAVKGQENEEIIFLGDYVDPYCSLENIPLENGLKSLAEIIEFKKSHPKNVILLLGNHDLSYLSERFINNRYDCDNDDKIIPLISDNLSLFKIAHEKKIGSTRYIFSHAGILPTWLEYNDFLLGEIPPGKEVEIINKLFPSNELLRALSNVSSYRGGYHDAGSCVWADVHEHFDLEPINDINTYQIFGHTRQRSEDAVITDKFACIDCRHAFILDDEGNLTRID